MIMLDYILSTTILSDSRTFTKCYLTLILIADLQLVFCIYIYDVIIRRIISIVCVCVCRWIQK